MAKLVLDDLVNLENQISVVTTINNNNAKIEAALEKTLSRDGTEPNEMNTDLDMNSHRIFNLPKALTDTEPVRLREFNSAIGAVGDVADFNVLYLGSKTSPPATDNDGNPLQTGALYFQSTGPSTGMYVWDGDSWEITFAAGLEAGTVSFAPTADISSTNVQAAIEEVYAAINVGSVDSENVAFAHPELTAPPIVVSLKSLLSEGLTARMCASTPIGAGQDATAALQKLATECSNLGFTGILGKGDFPITASMVFDEAGAEVVDAPRGGLRGEGPSGTRIRPASGVTPIVVRGGTAPGSVGLVYNAKFSDFMLLQVNGTGVGLNIDNFAWGSFENLFITGFETGIFATDFLSSSIKNSRIRGNGRGIYAGFADFSRPNALTLSDVNLGANVEYGAVFSGPTTLNWSGGAVEGNGWTGIGLYGFQGGVLLLNGAVEGVVGSNFNSVYFEYNKGSADLQISHTANDAAHNVHGCTFNRIHSTNYVNNNIFVENGGSGEVVVNLTGNGFKAFNTYTENPTRPYLSVTGAVKVNSPPGNIYKSDTAYVDPAKFGSAVRSGQVAADGSSIAMPRLWTSSKTGTGVYAIAHGLGTTDYVVNATTNSGSVVRVERVIAGTHTFEVVVTNVAGTATDGAFGFTLTRN